MAIWNEKGRRSRSSGIGDEAGTPRLWSLRGANSAGRTHPVEPRGPALGCAVRRFDALLFTKTVKVSDNASNLEG
jgi:hypothetical protein